MTGLKRFVVWRWLVAGLLCVLGAAITACGSPANPGVKPPEEGQARVFPLIAAPGDPVWLLDAPRAVSPQGSVRVGGQTAQYTTDPASGWLHFEVPQKAGGGPQPLEFVGLPSPGLNLTLTILPPESASQDTVLYAAASDLADVQKTYSDRLNRLLGECQGTCPSELTKTIERLAALKLPAFVPLLSGRTPGKQALASPALRSEVGVSKFPSPTPQPQPSQFCGQVSGVLPSSGLRTGQVISLLNLLFGGSLGVDPFTSGHPAQAEAPYKNEPPSAIIKKFLDGPTGNGKGVVIHVLDTASNAADPFVMTGDVNYYNTIYKNRPYHGSIAGQVAQVVSPGATLDYQQVCDQNGDCSTLATVKALCAVAEEARKGGKHVVNLSAGGPYPALGLLWALREVAAAGVPTAASYGNRDDCAGLVPGDRCNHFPADWNASFATSTAPNAPTLLLSVAGWDIGTLQMATYNRGMLSPGVITPPPGVQAPGEFWFNRLPYFGSSFAAPVVSGVLANWMACKPGLPFLPLVSTPGQLPLPLSVVRACP